MPRAAARSRSLRAGGTISATLEPGADTTAGGIHRGLRRNPVPGQANRDRGVPTGAVRHRRCGAGRSGVKGSAGEDRTGVQSVSTETSSAKWFKSSRSRDGGECVEVAHLTNGAVGVRDSKNPIGPALLFTPCEWDAFTTGLQEGKFERPA
ncbi:DUF397 domain-containing protein [Nocardia nova]|nr:DUF397 domain-containing protein [Nocardia nova]PPJ05841.1 DUF397 domain-containing protein [Nocardia nova]